MVARALAVMAAASAALAGLQLGDFTPVPAAWGLLVPVAAAASVGMTRVSVHGAIGCVAAVTLASPLIAAALVALPASPLERAAVMRAALRAAFVADGLLLLPCLLGGVLLGRWVGGISEYYARPATWKRRRNWKL